MYPQQHFYGKAARTKSDAERWNKWCHWEETQRRVEQRLLRDAARDNNDKVKVESSSSSASAAAASAPAPGGDQRFMKVQVPSWICRHSKFIAIYFPVEDFFSSLVPPSSPARSFFILVSSQHMCRQEVRPGRLAGRVHKHNMRWIMMKKSSVTPSLSNIYLFTNQERERETVTRRRSRRNQ